MRLEEKGIIKEVNTPTDWVSSMVIVKKKSGKIRLCIDPKPLNRALKRSHYMLPVIEDIIISTLKTLKNIILQGWPEKSRLPTMITQYHGMWD